jgi:hypothetical protein
MSLNKIIIINPADGIYRTQIGLNKQISISCNTSFNLTFSVGNEEKKVRAIEEDVSYKQKVCAEDLEKAEPALVAAQEALDTLDKVSIFVRVLGYLTVNYQPETSVSQQLSNWCEINVSKFQDEIYYPHNK